jgi:hypothetical protein
MRAEWVKLASYNTGFEADVARATLESSNIPVQVRGHQVGLYGGSFQGPVLGGVDVYVPSPELETALEILQEGD